MFSKQKHNRGQLAVGLALGFACILAMFGLVFQSTLFTIDKTTMQTTSDYAVLIAANNQSDNLNKIREINMIINDAWLTAQSALQHSYAQMYQVVTADGMVVLNTVAPGVASGVTAGQVSAGDCNTLGQGVDKFYREKIIQAYEMLRSEAASSIITIIKDSNKLSFDDALKIFLAPENLPNGMYMELQHQLGNGFKYNSVRAEYDKGTLANNENYAYNILEENKNDPLFLPKNESRTFSYPKYKYTENSSCYCNPEFCLTCCMGPTGFSPAFTPSNVRVVRATEDTTYFIAGIRYTPTLSIIQKMLKIGVKNPDTEDEEFGKDMDAPKGKDKLFRDIEKDKRTDFTVMSAAKPYGGTYPEGGFIGDLTGLSGTAGDSFVGSKLFGIADTTETQGIRVHRADGTIQNKDYQGNANGVIPYFAEDFLH